MDSTKQLEERLARIESALHEQTNESEEDAYQRGYDDGVKSNAEFRTKYFGLQEERERDRGVMLRMRQELETYRNRFGPIQTVGQP